MKLYETLTLIRVTGLGERRDEILKYKTNLGYKLTSCDIFRLMTNVSADYPSRLIKEE